MIDLKPIVIATTIDKLKEKNRWGDNAPPVYLTTMKYVINKLSTYLDRHNKIGSIVYDDDIDTCTGQNDVGFSQI